MIGDRSQFVLVHVDDLNYCPLCGSDGDEWLASDGKNIRCVQCGLKL